MPPTALQCPKCKTSLLEGGFNLEAFTPCPGCASELQIEVFPAFFRQATAGQSGEAVMTEGEASCFYHPQKKAVLPCEGCGRFVCALCDCELQGQHLCPVCLETGRTKGKIKSLENTRTRYDNLALALALYPMLIFYFTVITAPMVFYVAIRYWKSPLGLTQGSRLRFVIAMLFATLQIGGWGLLLIAILAR
jgi:hypothetical protein